MENGNDRNSAAPPCSAVAGGVNPGYDPSPEAEITRLRASRDRARQERDDALQREKSALIVLDAYREHHKKFHPECNVSGPQNPPRSAKPDQMS